MFDDDQPDYFLDEDDTQEAQRPTQPQDSTVTQPAADPALRAGSVICFSGAADSDSAPSSASTPASDTKTVKPKRRRSRTTLRIILLASILVLGVAIYVRYFTPYISQARQQVYVTSVERRGVIFPTYEAQIVKADDITDNGRPYIPCTEVSVADQRCFDILARAIESHKPVTIVYSRYFGTLPWRGSSLTLVTDVQ